MTAERQVGTLSIEGATLEYEHLGPLPANAPTLVLLHEGLGSVGMWGPFRKRLQEQTGLGVFAYSRSGYGRSSPAVLPRPMTYHFAEALRVLPQVLSAIEFSSGLLIGHSDGTSIATIYASAHKHEEKLAGISLIAPLFMVEDKSVRAIAETKAQYDAGPLKDKLTRWHDNPDNTFYGWSGAWLDPQFRNWNISSLLPQIDIPIQIVVGTDDQYISSAQIDTARASCRRAVTVTTVPNAGHSPHLQSPEITLEAISLFAKQALRDRNNELRKRLWTKFETN